VHRSCYQGNPTCNNIIPFLKDTFPVKFLDIKIIPITETKIKCRREVSKVRYT
jgi:hypothetical protein